MWVKNIWHTYEQMLENQNITYEEVREFINKYIPQKLYRYRRFDQYYENNIMQGQVYLSSPNKYNDPFDSAVRFDYKRCLKTFFDGNSVLDIPEKIESNPRIRQFNQDIYEKFRKHIKIACFSEVNDSILMWSHYAENHSGFCIEYDTSKNELLRKLVMPVIYKKERYNATECLLTQSINIACNPVLYKDISWSYEKEWRLWRTEDYFENNPDYLELGNSITAIYLGACIKECDKDKVDNIEQWARIHNVKIYKMKLDDSAYKLLYS